MNHRGIFKLLRILPLMSGLLLIVHDDASAWGSRRMRKGKASSAPPAVPGWQIYSSPGTYNFTVPSYTTLTIKLNGGGGGGDYSFGGTPGTNGGNTTTSTGLVAGGGELGGGAGIASGGTTNLNGGIGGCDGPPDWGGSSSTGGTGGYNSAGEWPGGGGGTTGTDDSGPCSGGGGAYTMRVYTAGALTVGSTVTVVVGAAGVGQGGAYSGGSGRAVFEWDDPCAGTPAIGTVCVTGAKYAGSFDYGGSIGVKKLIIAPGGCTDSATPTCADGADTVTKTWGTSANHGTVSTTDGPANTQALSILTGTNAGKFCANMVYGGYSDWYLPGKDELNFIYTNKAAIGSFANAAYWSSTQSTNANTWSQDFTGGTQSAVAKTGAQRIRCIRRQ